ncbi:MAG: phosphoribosylglycinamide formyltransferase [Bacteroidales bacterium]|jgi:phosphoribosylglycinamide formyltransferase-1|nr:phosphoribosylglycinamide formyltransferase [Bacteroidales bacterium]
MKHLAVFASGTGTNFVAIAKACQSGQLDARVALMVCDCPGAPVIDRAAEMGIESFVFSPKDYLTKADFEAVIVKLLDEKKIDLVCLAGYMRIVGGTLLRAYEGKIINIHPSLLPAFKGAHAVEDAVAYGVKVYGITIHWVNDQLDGGKIIAQRAFPYEGSDPAEVHRIGQKIEHELYVQTIKELLCER